MIKEYFYSNSKPIQTFSACLIILISGFIVVPSIGWTQESTPPSQSSSSEIESKEYVEALEERLREQKSLIQELKMQVLDKEEQLFRLLSGDFKGAGDDLLKQQFEDKKTGLDDEMNSLKNRVQSLTADLRNKEISMQNLSNAKSQVQNQLDVAHVEKLQMEKKVRDWQLQLKENLQKADAKSAQEKQLLQSQIENLRRKVDRSTGDQQIKEFRNKVADEQIDGYKSQVLTMMREKEGKEEQLRKQKEAEAVQAVGNVINSMIREL